jgi:hypothetical protein
MPQALVVPQAQAQNTAQKHKSKKKKTTPTMAAKGGIVQAPGGQTFGQASS